MGQGPLYVLLAALVDSEDRFDEQLARAPPMTRDCSQCGLPFEPTGTPQYCCRMCLGDWARQRWTAQWDRQEDSDPVALIEIKARVYPDEVRRSWIRRQMNQWADRRR